MVTILFSCRTQTFRAVQTPRVEAWETQEPEFSDQLLIVRYLESFCKLAMESINDSFSLSAARLACNDDGAEVVFGNGLSCNVALDAVDLRNLRVGCLQLLSKLRPVDPRNDHLFVTEGLRTPAFPNEQMLVFAAMVDKLAGKTLSSPIFIRLPEIGDFHLDGQILPPRDRPVKNVPARFIGLLLTTDIKQRSARIDVRRDLVGSDQDDFTLKAKIASQEIWDKLCDAAKHSGLMQFEVQGTPKDDGSSQIDYEVQSILDVPPGDASPLTDG